MSEDADEPFAENGLPPFEFVRPWLYDKQRLAIFEPRDLTGARARYSLIEASTKIGKTIGCLAWLAEQAFAGRAGQNFWWVAPVYRQAKIAYRRAKRGLHRRLYIANESEMAMRLPNGATIAFLSAERPDGLYGEDVFAAVIDEATRIERPQLPADLLACEDAPAPPADAATQRAVAGYLAELWSALEDCHAKLAGVAKLLAEEGK
jgi:hypothetical protein